MTAEGPTPVTAEPAATPVAGPADALPAAGEIATLPPAPRADNAGLNPRTGEPRRGWLIRAAAAASWLAAATATASLLWTYWVAVDRLIASSWLTSRFTSVDVGLAVLLMVALTVTTLLVAISAVITGYYAWFGYRWTRITGIITAVLSCGMLMVNPIGWGAIALAVVSAGLLWLPQARTFFAAWHAHRHPEIAFAAPVTSVFYGPLPRYRKA